MSDTPTPTQNFAEWLTCLRKQDEEAARLLWEAYFGRLVEIARRRLPANFRTAADEEDVAVSVFRTFVRRVARGDFPNLLDEECLWALLIRLIRCKTANLIRWETREKRDVSRTQRVSTIESNSGSDQLSTAADPDLRSALVTEWAEESNRLLGLLPDTLRDIALWKLDGVKTKEIASKLNLDVSSVNRKLKLIRTILQEQAAGRASGKNPEGDV
jgi:DNA-directed RNA polymerase specialized sigma24 family protein